jgi:hypothetical protein
MLHKTKLATQRQVTNPPSRDNIMCKYTLHTLMYDSNSEHGANTAKHINGYFKTRIRRAYFLNERLFPLKKIP